MNKLDLYNKELDQLNKQRKIWLWASSIVVLGVVFLISFWNLITDYTHYKWITWSAVSLGLIISVNWWYWTMGMVRRSLAHQITVIEILNCITNDIKLVKEDVKELSKTVDKPK
jgi:hypothetical protein